jgi:putative Holliday junction resolvase
VEEGNQNHESTRILALDLGKKRIGMAISDPLGVTAQGLDTLARANIRADLAALAGLIAAKGVSLILMGKPLHMSGQEGRQAVWTRDFAERLNRATGVPVEFRDERLTTVQAERVLREGGVRLRKDRERSVDRLSAVLLLQDYLDSRRV